MGILKDYVCSGSPYSIVDLESQICTVTENIGTDVSWEEWKNLLVRIRRVVKMGSKYSEHILKWRQAQRLTYSVPTP
jgi:hypothetical protein